MTKRNLRSVVPLVLGSFLLLSSGLQSVVAQTGSPSEYHLQVQKISSAQGNGWLMEIVDSDSMANGFGIVADSNNIPHIAYSDYNPASDLYVLKYANRTGGEWKAEILEGLGETFIMHVTIALDSIDRPHIAYNDYDDGPGIAIKHTNWTGGQWRTTTLDSGSMGTQPTSIALDSKDYPHVIYNRDLHVMHANWTGTHWGFEELAFAGLPRSIAIDDNDYPHIGYPVKGGLEYAKWNGTDWSIERVVNYTVEFASLELDNRYNPHIVFSGYPDFDIKYAEWNGSGWEIETVESHGEFVCYSALDRFDLPHLICKQFDLDPVAIRYAIRIGGSWQIETVDRIGHMSNDFPMTVDYDGNPHLAYHDITVGHLSYATKRIEPPSRNITLDIDPDTLNLKSRGRWITAYLGTDNAKVEDINASSLVLNDILAPAWWDVRDERVLMVKFDRSAVQGLLPVSDSVDIKITGQWMDGEGFEAHDAIRVIDPVQPRQVFLSFPPRASMLHSNELNAIYAMVFRLCLGTPD
ncbi:MAG: hypothetical protein ACW99U_16680 [Candidatus Thorarchaeota archaeon]|jgi:hypothetical protein